MYHMAQGQERDELEGLIDKVVEVIGGTPINIAISVLCNLLARATVVYALNDDAVVDIYRIAIKRIREQVSD